MGVAKAPKGPPIPDGVKLVRTLRGHTGEVGRIAWSSDGNLLASPSFDNTIRVWDSETGDCLHVLAPLQDPDSIDTPSVAFQPNGEILASAFGATVSLWNPSVSRIHRTLSHDMRSVQDISWSPDGKLLAAASADRRSQIWDSTGDTVRVIEGENVLLSVKWASDARRIAFASVEVVIVDSETRRVRRFPTKSGIYDIAWWPNPATDWLAMASADHNVHVLDTREQKEIVVLEGHTGHVRRVAVSSDGRLLASTASDGRMRLWDARGWRPLWKTSASPTGLAFHPNRPWLAAVARDGKSVNIWQFDVDLLNAESRTSIPSVTYTTAKIVLVGDSGVGKTGLGWRLAHGHFKEHASTHGQQFWLLEQLRTSRRDGTECEAILWDLAGQPDYRMIHALFVDDADVALVVFDPTHAEDPMKGVEFWLKQLRVGGTGNNPIAILIAARTDRGTGRLTTEDLDAFCRARGLKGYIGTSALRGYGIENVIDQLKESIIWDEKTATVTTTTFKRIKDHVLRLKEDRRSKKVILTPAELRKRLEKANPKWKFTDDEMLTAVGHIAKHGFAAQLRTSNDEYRFLIVPDLLNNVAASLIVAARANPKGLGSLEEQALLAGNYPIQELEGISRAERDILIDSAAVLFLQHNVCFRETDPLSGRSYLVFPELINLKKPSFDEEAVDHGGAYTVIGAVENVYASLVVLLGYTDKFTRTNQWRNQARYEVAGSLVCGFRLESEQEGELDLVLYYGRNVGTPIRTLFQALFESFLARRNLTILRFDPVVCSQGHRLNRAVLRECAAKDKRFAFCPECGEKLTLPKVDRPIQLTQQQEADVEEQRRGADQRSRFEQAIFRLRSYVEEQKVKAPACFVSYAWGDPEHERWVEKLASDLLKAGINVILDRWENARIGYSVPRFVERVENSDYVIVIGTPRYRRKYDNAEPMRGFVVAAEGDLIGKRMIGSEARKQTVLPLLVEGDEETAFPPILHGRVYGDFRMPMVYFSTALDLILSLYDVPRQIGVKLSESLRPERL